jgi:Zn/Cd-binding protein ZinT
VLVKNSGNFNVLKWSGSLDGGSTADTKIYWKNGLSASITRVDQAKDIITFVNIDNKIFGSAINNFQ